MSIANPEGHSATVDLQLHIDGQVFPLAQVAPEYCVLTKPTTLPPGRAEIVVIIDGHVQRSSVELAATPSATERRVALKRLRPV